MIHYIARAKLEIIGSKRVRSRNLDLEGISVEQQPNPQSTLKTNYITRYTA